MIHAATSANGPFPLRDHIEFFAYAALFALKARAAQNHYGWVGFAADLGCTVASRDMMSRQGRVVDVGAAHDRIRIPPARTFS